MDPNIDPEMHTAIQSQFQKYTLPSDNYASSSHNNNRDNHEEFINNEDEQASTNFSTYTSIDDDHHSEGSSAEAEAAVAAAAVANMSSMINFNSLDDNETDEAKQEPVKIHHKIIKGNNKTNSKSMSFLNALDLEANSPQSSVSTSNPKQRLIHDSGSQVSIVVVNPASKEGSGRLGRPRKHTTINSSSSEDTAFDNYDKSMVSRFRVDNQPLSGPGSRGARKKHSPSESTKPQPLRKKIQQVLKFDNFKKKNVVLPVTFDSSKMKQRKTFPDSSETIDISSDSEDEEISNTPKEQKGKKQKTTTTTSSEPKEETKKSRNEREMEIKAQEHCHLDLDDYDDLKDVPIAIPTKPQVPELATFKPVKKRKDYPSPLTGLFNDMYEEPTFNVSAPEFNQIALGYQVIATPYARDILHILSFYNKFKKHFSEIPNLGAQDLEVGLKLNPSIKYTVQNVNQKFAKSELYDEEIYGPQSQISDLMESLYLKLLSLVLNKRKDFTKSSIAKSSIALKENVLSWGLPQEWRDDLAVFKQNSLNSPTLADDFEPVDPNHPELLEPELVQYGTSFPSDETPLDDPLFESRGLAGLQPKDRLILLRSLVEWCLSESKVIKDEMQQFSEGHSYTEKETYYCPRYVKGGQSSIDFANTGTKTLNFKKKTNRTDLDMNLDASSNPIKSFFFLRSLDFFAGDGGLAGRFYLCRTYSHEIGHLLNGKDVKDLSSKFTNDLLAIEQPSRFKLYVQDLATALKNEKDLTSEKMIDPWYEIAENVEELKKFTDFLSKKLESVKSKSLKCLLEYLLAVTPVLAEFENIYINYQPRSTRSSRRKQVTDLKEQEANMKKLIDYDTGSESENEEDEEDEEVEEENQNGEDMEFVNEDEDYDEN